MSQKQVSSWEAIVAKRMSQHFRQFHAGEAVSGRRSFFRAMAGLSLSSGLLVPGLVQGALNHKGGGGDDDDDAVLPNPIPGGAKPLGILVHHYPLTPGTPLANIDDPSEITDFNGFIGDTQIRGAGTGTGFADPLAFRADMGFMKGEYIGEDGRHHHGTFCFI